MAYFTYMYSCISSAMKVEPNAAHEALAKFSVADLRRSIAPVASFHLVTQNVDGLSVRALERVTQALGDSPLSDTDVSHTIEMHGRLLDTICTLCSNTVYDESSPICEGLAGTEQIMELKNNDVDPIVALDELPHCAICQGLLRPGVVWFGEMPKQLEEIDELVEEADLAIVVGASSTVSTLAHICLSNTRPTIISRYIPRQDTHLTSKGEEELWLCSTWSGVQATTKRTSCSWGHAKRPYLRLCLASSIHKHVEANESIVNIKDGSRVTGRT